MEKEFVKKKNEVCSVKEFSDTILYNVDAYIILVDRNFLVEKTNYYNLNNTSEGQVLRRVGELLRCKNGLDAGACGSHENCKVCPVRNSIEKCFREKGHFSPLETPMRLYMSEKMDNYVDCIVCVSGTYLQLDQDDKVLLTVRDVTRQKKILDELEEARRNAEWAGEQKTAFLANMSHEIRTPLNAIVGFAGLLGTASDQDRISYVEIIKGNTNMLLQLVNDILDMSKIEAGTLEFIYTDVDVNQIMRELEGIFRLRLEEADVPVRIIFEPKLPVCFIHTEKNRISQVISNFLSNAFKYTPEEGEIQVSLATGHDMARKDALREYFEIAITDSGIGIDRNKIERIFERFYQIDNDVTKSNFGTGIGLHLSRSLVQLHHGEILAENREDAPGSRFIIRIPLGSAHLRTDELETVDAENVIYHTVDKPVLAKLEEELIEEEEEPKAAIKAKTRLRVLVVEDEDEIKAYLKAELSDEYKVETCSNGKEAYDLVLRDTPDLVISDVMMPEMDGLTLCRKIKLNTNVNHVPVILLLSLIHI